MVFMELSSQVHARLWATSLCKMISCHGMSFLGSGLLGRRLQRRLCDFLPCPCSFAMSFWLFPPQHPIFWVIQQVLNKQPCHTYMFLSRVALYGSCAKTVWIGHVDKGRVVFHQFSHSSVKSIVICKCRCNSWCLCSFTKFLWLVLG